MTQQGKNLMGGISVLGLAGLICKVVGVLYRIPLANIVGPLGLATYQQVFPTYNLLLTVSSAGLPVAISRMVSHSLTRGEPANARRIFREALRLLTLLGAAATLVMALISGPMARAIGTPDARLGFIAIAPSLFFVCVMSALRGYLQGRRHMAPTAVSQLIEQVGKVFIALPFAAAGTARGGTAMGAAGALLGTSVAEGAALVYMLAHHRKTRGEVERLLPGDTSAPLDAAFVRKRLVFVAIPITLGACIVPLAGMVDSVMLVNLLQSIGFPNENANIAYGLYAGIVLPLINVPTALAMAMAANLVPAISAGAARGDRADIARQSTDGLRIAFLVGLPCSIGMSIYAHPIVNMLFHSRYTPEQIDLAASLLVFSSLTIVLFTVVQATSGILQGLGKQRIPMYTLMAGVAVKVALNYTLIRVPQVNIHGAPFASLACYAVSMLPNLYYVKKYAGVRFDLRAIFVRPLLATAVMAAFTGVARVLVPERAVYTIAVIALACCVYAVAAVKCGALVREDVPARLRKKIWRES